MSGGEADGRGGYCLTSKGEEGILQYLPSHAWATDIVIVRKIDILLGEGIDQYPYPREAILKK